MVQSRDPNNQYRMAFLLSMKIYISAALERYFRDLYHFISSYLYYMAYMDYMEPNVLCPKKADKVTHSLTHSINQSINQSLIHSSWVSGISEFWSCRIVMSFLNLIFRYSWAIVFRLYILEIMDIKHIEKNMSDVSVSTVIADGLASEDAQWWPSHWHGNFLTVYSREVGHHWSE